MARLLYQREPVFRAELQALDEISHAVTGRPLLPGLLTPPEPYDDIRDTHPGIFAVQVAGARLLQHYDIHPAYLMGLSTGEFAAAVIGGVWTPEEGMRAIWAQAHVLTEHCPRGGMLAILRPVALYRSAPWLSERTELALESRRHFVVAGDAADLDEIQKTLWDRGTTHHRMPVTRAFHSCLIDPAEQAYADLVESLPRRSPRVPLVSCAAGGVRGSEPLHPRRLWDAIREPIRFGAAADAMAARGEFRLVDIGPGSSLSTLVRHNEVPTLGCYPFIAPGVDCLARITSLRSVAG
jgi:trans-AT polyketide synthase/acyltransferase/oxidoreductase domain-containing protein